jgi:uncharacterized membrane protein YqaE (UPF0057 family)
MSKNSILIALALVAMLIIVAIFLPPLPSTKKHGIRIQAVNSLPTVSFTLTNGLATIRPPEPKP